jgi:pyruvate/2-oxoglutarate dehydrogenase complex dihydrolipoamide acyltransferase (E2) component
MLHPIRVNEYLWNGAMAPEGILDGWYRDDGAQIAAGDKLAEVEIEGVRHEVTAPVGGRLRVLIFAGAILDPGDVIGQVV